MLRCRDAAAVRGNSRCKNETVQFSKLSRAMQGSGLNVQSNDIVMNPFPALVNVTSVVAVTLAPL